MRNKHANEPHIEDILSLLCSLDGALLETPSLKQKRLGRLHSARHKNQ